MILRASNMLIIRRGRLLRAECESLWKYSLVDKEIACRRDVRGEPHTTESERPWIDQRDMTHQIGKPHAIWRATTSHSRQTFYAKFTLPCMSASTTSTTIHHSSIYFSRSFFEPNDPTNTSMPSLRSVALAAILSISHSDHGALAHVPCPPATPADVLVQLNGDAVCIDGKIRLTPELGGQLDGGYGQQSSTAFTDSTFADNNNYPFESFVEFVIDDKELNSQADGAAFIIHNDPAGLNAIAPVGGYGGRLGIYNGLPGGGPGGITNALVVEFDTYDNFGRDAPFSEKGYDQAIDVLTTDSNGYVTRHYEQDVSSIVRYWKEFFGQPLHIKLWISYSVRDTGVLDIYLGGKETNPRPQYPFISIPVDLSAVLTGGSTAPNQVYCGLSASTGGSTDKHEVISFSGCPEYLLPPPGPCSIDVSISCEFDDGTPCDELEPQEYDIEECEVDITFTYGLSNYIDFPREITSFSRTRNGFPVDLTNDLPATLLAPGTTIFITATETINVCFASTVSTTATFESPPCTAGDRYDFEISTFN